jgi:hypothetical protein
MKTTHADVVGNFFVGGGLYLLQAVQSVHRARMFDHGSNQIRPEFDGLRQYYRERVAPDALAGTLCRYLASGEFRRYSKGLFPLAGVSREDIIWTARSLYSLSNVLQGYSPLADEFSNLEACLHFAHARWEMSIKRLRSIKRESHSRLNYFNRYDGAGRAEEIEFWAGDGWHLYLAD